MNGKSFASLLTFALKAFKILVPAADPLASVQIYSLRLKKDTDRDWVAVRLNSQRQKMRLKGCMN